MGNETSTVPRQSGADDELEIQGKAPPSSFNPRMHHSQTNSGSSSSSRPGKMIGTMLQKASQGRGVGSGTGSGAGKGTVTGSGTGNANDFEVREYLRAQAEAGEMPFAAGQAHTHINSNTYAVQGQGQGQGQGRPVVGQEHNHTGAGSVNAQRGHHHGHVGEFASQSSGQRQQQGPLQNQYYQQNALNGAGSQPLHHSRTGRPTSHQSAATAVSATTSPSRVGVSGSRSNEKTGSSTSQKLHSLRSAKAGGAALINSMRNLSLGHSLRSTGGAAGPTTPRRDVTDWETKWDEDDDDSDGEDEAEIATFTPQKKNAAVAPTSGQAVPYMHPQLQRPGMDTGHSSPSLTPVTGSTVGVVGGGVGFVGSRETNLGAQQYQQQQEQHQHQMSAQHHQLAGYTSSASLIDPKTTTPPMSMSQKGMVQMQQELAMNNLHHRPAGVAGVIGSGQQQVLRDGRHLQQRQHYQQQQQQLQLQQQQQQKQQQQLEGLGSEWDATSGPTQQNNAKPNVQMFLPLLRVLGKGSFGKVVLVQKRIGKERGALFAMKILRKTHLVKRRQIERTRTERKVLSAVNHPFIMKLHYAFQTPDKLYLVLDYCPGGELFFHLSRFRRFPERVARFYAAELLLAIGHLHKRGIIYRDLKPENVLLDADGHVKLGDFGLAKAGIKHPCEGAISMCGTPEYMAPEVLSQEGHGFCVDYWGLGMLVYEMMTGLPPWYTTDRSKLFRRLKSAPLDIPSYFSAQSASCANALLERNPRRRLGVTGVKSAMEHDYFRAINWRALYGRLVEAPVRPCEGWRPPEAVPDDGNNNGNEADLLAINTADGQQRHQNLSGRSPSSIFREAPQIQEMDSCDLDAATANFDNTFTRMPVETEDGNPPDAQSDDGDTEELHEDTFLGFSFDDKDREAIIAADRQRTQQFYQQQQQQQQQLQHRQHQQHQQQYMQQQQHQNQYQQRQLR